MDKRGNGHIDYELLGKYLSGNATDNERQQVEEWLAASEENRKEFDALKAIWQNAPDEEAPTQVDVDAAWSKLHQRMHASGFRPKSRGGTLEFRTILLRAAAVLVIAAAIWGAFYLIRNTSGPSMKMVASRDAIKEISLPDGSIVTMNKHSFLSYPAVFSDSNRSVHLAGEAFFKVNPDPSKPFFVNTGEAHIRVLGTEFNVLAFEDSQRVDVDVIEGKVLLYKEDNRGYVVDSVRLTKGEKGIFYKNRQELVETAADPAAIYWQSKTLIFERTELSKVFEVLDGIFEVEILAGSRKIESCRLTATFRDERIENIMEVIASTFKLEVNRIDHKFKLTGEGCQ